MQRFTRLFALLESDPDAYLAEVARMKRDQPERYARLLEVMGRAVERTNEAEDQPMTELEVEEVIERTCAELGWPRERVIAEGVLRLRAARAEGKFTPVTPEHDPKRRPGRYARRRSSMDALVIGDVNALIAKRRAR